MFLYKLSQIQLHESQSGENFFHVWGYSLWLKKSLWDH